MARDKAKALQKQLKKVQKRHEKMTSQRKKLYSKRKSTDAIDEKILEVRKQEEDLKKQIKAMSSLQSLRF